MRWIAPADAAATSPPSSGARSRAALAAADAAVFKSGYEPQRMASAPVSYAAIGAGGPQTSAAFTGRKHAAAQSPTSATYPSMADNVRSIVATSTNEALRAALADNDSAPAPAPSPAPARDFEAALRDRVDRTARSSTAAAASHRADLEAQSPSGRAAVRPSVRFATVR